MRFSRIGRDGFATTWGDRPENPSGGEVGSRCSRMRPAPARVLSLRKRQGVRGDGEPPAAVAPAAPPSLERRAAGESASATMPRRAIPRWPTRGRTSMPIALAGNGASWECLCPARKWDSRTAADRCGRDSRAPRTSVSARSDSTEPMSARANRFRSVKRSCDAAPRRVRQAGRPRRSREPEAAGRSRMRRLARRPSVADGGHEADGFGPPPGSASMR